MRFEATDFARCAGNPCFAYCEKCKRWVVNAPVPPESMRSVWIGPWVLEDEKCPSFIAVPDSRSEEDV